MGHNTHFVCVNARTGKEALDTAAFELEGWGNENNRRTFVRAISEKGKVVEGEAIFKEFSSLEEINRSLRGRIASSKVDQLTKMFDELVTKLRHDGRLSGRDWYEVGRIVKQMGEIECAREAGKAKDKFDVFKQEYYSGEYDEFGVTHRYSDWVEPKKKRLPRWVVVMDMHS